MNRELKFRLWQTCWPDKELQIMHPVKGIDFEDQVYWVTTSQAGYLFKDAILMQFTGLKDRNGIDIYEGDIIESGGEVVSLFTVVFKDGGFWYKNEDGSTFIPFAGHQWLENILKRFHVIGNIYMDVDFLLVDSQLPK